MLRLQVTQSLWRKCGEWENLPQTFDLKGVVPFAAKYWVATSDRGQAEARLSLIAIHGNAWNRAQSTGPFPYGVATGWLELSLTRSLAVDFGGKWKIRICERDFSQDW
jgi:hypothetical protein